jgi:hypothetical protein
MVWKTSNVLQHPLADIVHRIGRDQHAEDHQRRAGHTLDRSEVAPEPRH